MNDSDTNMNSASECLAPKASSSNIMSSTTNVKKNVEWANTIKNHHNIVRMAVTGDESSAQSNTSHKAQNKRSFEKGKGAQNTSSSSSVTPQIILPSSEALDESYTRWRKQRDDGKEQLEAYAVAMHDLATKFWSRGEARGALSGTKRPRGGEEEGANENEEDNRKNTEENEEPQLSAAEFSATNGRYDDRVSIVVDAVKDFFFGDITAVTDTNANTNGDKLNQRGTCVHFAKYPTILTQQLRPHRRAYFESHGAQMPHAEEEKIIAELVASGSPGGCLRRIVEPALAAVNSTTRSSDRHNAEAATVTTTQTYYEGREKKEDVSAISKLTPLIPLDVLDVGSCYGPYRGEFDGIGTVASGNERPFAVRGRHVDVDLCPYKGSGVHQLDWLDCAFHTPPKPKSVGEDSHVAVESLTNENEIDSLVKIFPSSEDGEGAIKKVSTLRSGSFDVVIFCFMLSYLPTREMRLRSCYNALRALRDEGLFCIVSTRTQGPRSGKWIAPWTSCIEELGFKLAQKEIKSKVILLTFQKLRSCESATAVGAVETKEAREVSAGDSVNAAALEGSQTSSAQTALNIDAAEAYYRERFLPLLLQFPEGMSLHEQSI